MRRHHAMAEVARPFSTGPRWLVIGVLGLTGSAMLVRAGDIYKSVDANGNVTYSDHRDPLAKQSTLVQLEDPRFPPHELHFCWANCFTLTLDNGVYRRVDGTDENWTVEKFSADAVVLHRHDAPDNRDVVYAGQVANDRLIGVTVNGKPTAGIDASWGSALNTLPANNAERDAKSTSGSDPAIQSVSNTAAPPPVQAEEQPVLAEDGYLWTPGFWYWRNHAYFWVTGSWQRPPQAGLLWTPAFWSSAGSVFVFHPGHWGSAVGYYGGVNYGYGYYGNGYTGGRWIGTAFAYNTSVNRTSAIASHTYAESLGSPVSRSGTASHVVPRQAVVREAGTSATTPRSERVSDPVMAARTVSATPASDAKAPSSKTPAPRIDHVTPAKAVIVK